MRLRAVWSLLALLALGLSACGSSSAAGGGTVTPPPDSDLFTAGTLTIGSDISYPPQEYFDPPGSNTSVGFDIDLGKELAKKMGLKFTALNTKFDAIITDMSAKKFDVIISAMTDNSERRQKVDFVDYFNAGESFVVKKGSAAHPTKLEDLCGQSIAVEKGTAEETEATDTNDPAKQGKCAADKIKLQSFDTDTQALVELKKGTVTIHFTDSPVAGYELRHDSSLAVSGGVIEIAPEGIAVRKGDSAMLNAIKQAFKALEDDGTYDSLLTKWGLKDGDIRKASS